MTLAGDLERVLNKLDELADEVGDLRVSVARLETRLEQPAPASKPGLVRDGSMTAAGGALGAALAALLAHFAKG